MRQLAWAVAFALLASAPAAGQSPVFVSGAVFGDVKRFSGDTATNVLDGTTVGGGGRIGVFLGSSWTIETGADAGGFTTVTHDVPQLVGKAAPLPPRRQSRTRNRLIAATTLVGFHPAAKGRVRLGYLGGLTLLHVTRKADSLVAGVVQPNERDAVDYVPAATLAIEAHVALSGHVGVVPDLRVFAFTLNGAGQSGVAIRPGAAIRWTF